MVDVGGLERQVVGRVDRLLLVLWRIARRFAHRQQVYQSHHMSKLMRASTTTITTTKSSTHRSSSRRACPRTACFALSTTTMNEYIYPAVENTYFDLEKKNATTYRDDDIPRIDGTTAAHERGDDRIGGEYVALGFCQLT